MTKGPLLLTAVVVAATASAPAPVYAHGGGPHGAIVVGAAPSYYYAPFWNGWYGYQYPAAYPVFYDNSSSLRIQVEPRETEVYVDGYYAGTVNDFDGFFQRLHVSPGQHDIELFLDGYRAVKQQVYLQPGATFKVRYTMQKLQAGDTAEERPTPPRQPPAGAGAAPQAPPPPPPPPAAPRQRSGARPESAPPADDAFGALVIQVQPADAEIVVDGEPWQSAGGARLVLQLPPGDHRIEVRKNGFQTFRSSVRIRRGETTPINVSLAQE